MNYKEHELFKMLNESENTMSATVDAGDYDMKFTFSVVDGELQTVVCAVIGRYEQPISVGEKYEEEMFINVCEQFNEWGGEEE